MPSAGRIFLALFGIALLIIGLGALYGMLNIVLPWEHLKDVKIVLGRVDRNEYNMSTGLSRPCNSLGRHGPASD